MPRALRMLMVSPVAPWPATTGGLVRIAALIGQMSRHFQLKVIFPGERQHVPAISERLELVCAPASDAGAAAKMAALVDPSRPYHVRLYARPALRDVVRRELTMNAFDVIYSHFIYGLEFLRGAPAPVIVDQQNVDRVYWRNRASYSSFPANLFAVWNARRTIEYERRRLPDIWAYVSVSEEDRQQTRQYAQGIVPNFWVAPNGVDTSRFRPAERAGESEVICLGYLGSMDLPMNIDAVQRFWVDLLPRIRQRLPDRDVRFLVIGRNPPASLRATAATIPGVSLTGTVEDVATWLHKVTILVAPVRIGAGTKLKVAEALACGLPVVGSSLAFAGLPGRSDEHYMQADSDTDFVDAVCRLAERTLERSALGHRARLLAEAHLEWDAIGNRLAEEIRSALRK